MDCGIIKQSHLLLCSRSPSEITVGSRSSGPLGSIRKVQRDRTIKDSVRVGLSHIDQSSQDGSSLIGLYGILADILSLASSFECFSFHWISRIKNAEADKLAKQVLSAELAVMTTTTLV